MVEKKENEEMKQVWNAIKVINYPFKKHTPKPNKEEDKEKAEKEPSEESEVEVIHTPSNCYIEN